MKTVLLLGNIPPLSLSCVELLILHRMIHIIPDIFARVLMELSYKGCIEKHWHSLCQSVQLVECQ